MGGGEGTAVPQSQLGSKLGSQYLSKLHPCMMATPLSSPAFSNPAERDTYTGFIKTTEARKGPHVAGAPSCGTASPSITRNFSLTPSRTSLPYVGREQAYKFFRLKDAETLLVVLHVGYKYVNIREVHSHVADA